MSGEMVVAVFLAGELTGAFTWWLGATIADRQQRTRLEQRRVRP